MKQQYDVIIIGAGAAGLTCAGFAAQQGCSVLLLEKNDRPARKVLITGKGRCNVTNNCDEDAFIKAMRSNPRFMYGAIHAFTTQDTIRFFEGLGVPLKTERGNRVFPVSDRAADIADGLISFARRAGTQLHKGAVRSVLRDENGVTGVRTQAGETFYAPVVVVATGGLSYPLTGSTGDGYRMAEELGHTVVPTEASLVPLVTREKWCTDLMGLSLRNVTLSLWEQGKKKPVYQELGEMLFTHFGLSGPLVLSASSHMSGDLSRYTVTIDCKPGLSAEQLDARLLRDFEKYKNKDFANALDDLLPRKLIPIVVTLSGIDSGLKVHQITRVQRQTLIGIVKGLTLHPKAFRPVEEAIITAGGVSVKEVDPRTMESKLCPGLYFVGEVLDLDGYTGGYNLQIAFSTAHLAAQSIAQRHNAE